MRLRAKVATLSVTLLGFAAAGSASAQSIGQAITDALNKKSQVLQQQADNERPRAKAEPMSAAVEARSSQAKQASRGRFAQASSKRYFVAGGGNDFALLKVPTYRLPNGLGLQFSGEFSPGEGVTCTADCPAGGISVKR